MSEIDKQIIELVEDRMKPSDAAEALDLAVGSIHNKFCTGELKKIKRGRKVYASKKQVLKILQESIN